MEFAQTNVNRLNKDINDLLDQPDVKQKFADMGMVPLGGTSEQYKKFIHEDFYKWKTMAAKEKLLETMRPQSLQGK